MERRLLHLSTDYVKPAGETEAKLAEVWADAFGLDIVGRDDDFFELGGDSLTAESLATAIRSTFGAEIRQSQFLEANTPAKVAKLVSAALSWAEEAWPSNLTAVNRGGKRPPMLLLPGNAGMVFLRPRFLEGLHPEQPVYIVQAQGFDGKAEPLRTVEDMAAAYVKLARDHLPRGELNLVAFCGGGFIAIEMLRLMRDDPPRRAILVDLLATRRMQDQQRRRTLARETHAVKRLVGSARNVSKDFYRKAKNLVRAGVFISEEDPAAIHHPKFRDYMARRLDKISDGRRRLKNLERKLRGKEQVHYGPEGTNGDYERSFFAEPARLTRMYLTHALANHDPKPTDYPVVVVGREELRRELANPDHVLSSLLPNHRMIVSGQTHKEAVMSVFTSSILQSLLDGVEPDVVALDLRELSEKTPEWASSAASR